MGHMEKRPGEGFPGLRRVPGGKARTTETHRVVQQVTAPDGRTAVRVQERVVESEGVEPPPTAPLSPGPTGEEKGCLHHLGAGVVAFALMLVAFELFWSPTDHPLAVFLYWLGAMVIYGMLV